VPPVTPKRDHDREQRDREHIGRELQRAALGDAALRQGQGVDLPRDVYMEDTPGGEEERPQTSKQRGRHPYPTGNDVASGDSTGDTASLSFKLWRPAAPASVNY